jgi:hypothetical protein
MDRFNDDVFGGYGFRMSFQALDVELNRLGDILNSLFITFALGMATTKRGAESMKASGVFPFDNDCVIIIVHKSIITPHGGACNVLGSDFVMWMCCDNI